MRKGFIFTTDVLIGLSLIVLTLITLGLLQHQSVLPEKEYERLSYMSDDVMNALAYLKVSEVQDKPTINGLIQSDVLTQKDLDKSILDLIASFWYTDNKTIAENISREVLEGVTDDLCINLTIGFEIIYNSSCNAPAKDVAVATRIETGYESGLPTYGYISRASLASIKSKRDSSYVYFGGFVGEGNITRIMSLPPFDKIKEVYMELDAGGNFNLSINNNPVGSFIKGSGGGGNMTLGSNKTSDNWVVCNATFNPSYCSLLIVGDNKISFNFTGNLSFIGGGYFRVSYNTTQMAPPKVNGTDRYWFPGIDGFINLYDSFYVPGTLKNITAYLHYYNKIKVNDVGVPVYLKIGNKTVFESNATGEQKINLTQYNFTNAFGSLNNLINYVSNKTIPLRLGVETFVLLAGEGVADAVLITDVSGSMSSNCDVDTTECLYTDCNLGRPGCQNRRLDVAKDVDKDFVDGILDLPGDRVGLISYSASPGIRNSTPLTADKNRLNNQIDSYSAQGNTCISCGIVRATTLLDRNVTYLISEKSTWLYTTSYPSSSPPNDLDGYNWTEKNYNASSWNNGQAILGFDNYPYSPAVDTNIGNNGGNYYFRKNFTVNTSKLEAAWFYALSDDKAEIYLNGHLIDNDTVKHNASYWNRGITVLYDDFENYSSKCGRVDGYALNLPPGFWYIDDGNGNPNVFGEEVYLMCNNPSYPAHNGTSVLVFRDMDNYGYAETTLNLSAYADVELSYWWRTGPNFFGSNERGDVFVWDGEWHSIAYYDDGDGNNVYLHSKIDLSPYKMINNFKIRFGSRSSDDNERFYIDQVNVRAPIPIDKSYFVDGENVIAVKLYNSDSSSAKFDLELLTKTNEIRKRAMLVMSDGAANTLIDGSYDVDQAKNEAIDRACIARDNYGIVVYSVGFGGSADATTLAKIACWNCTGNSWLPGESLQSCSRFYNSSNADELEEIYKKIAADIVELSYTAQTINITGSVKSGNSLFTDSYIEFNYTDIKPEIEYGEISLTRETNRFGGIVENHSKEGWFNVSDRVKIVEAKVTSYSSEYWTDRLWVNSSATNDWKRVYWLGDYGDTYESFGDPFIINIPKDYISGGNNSVRIGTGITPINETGGSPDDRVIYTMRIKGSVGYGLPFETAEGARNDAIDRLNETVRDYVDISMDDIDVATDIISGIRWLWGPSLLKIVMWKNQ